MLSALEARNLTKQKMKQFLSKELDTIEAKIIDTIEDDANEGRVYQTAIEKPSEEAERALKAHEYNIIPCRDKEKIIISWA